MGNHRHWKITMSYVLLGVFITILLVWWIATRPTPQERAIVIGATQGLQEQYNKREFTKIVSLLDGQTDGAGAAFLGRLLPYLRAGTGSCDIESAGYQVHKVRDEGILVRAAFSCEASTLTYFATWRIGKQARLIEWRIDGNLWKSVPGLWDHRFEIVGIEQ